MSRTGVPPVGRGLFTGTLKINWLEWMFWIDKVKGKFRPRVTK